jgi:hypothetical protein
MYALLELYSLLLDGGDDGANKQGPELSLQIFFGMILADLAFLFFFFSSLAVPQL